MDASVGTKLREARARRRLSLSAVEATTKIRTRHLRAIENEEWDLLPGETYARAFIRTYADHLGLDGERLAEEYRRERGIARPGERLQVANPAPLRRGPARSRLRVPPRPLAAVVSALLAAIVVAIGISSGGGGAPGGPGEERGPAVGGAIPVDRAEPPTVRRSGLTLSITATAEVWICLLNERDEPLIDGLILSSGSREGPYRSGSFTVSFGNGAVRMDVNGEQASIPETASPVGFSVAGDGTLRQLSEGERPTCT